MNVTMKGMKHAAGMPGGQAHYRFLHDGQWLHLAHGETYELPTALAKEIIAGGLGIDADAPKQEPEPGFGSYRGPGGTRVRMVLPSPTGDRGIHTSAGPAHHGEIVLLPTKEARGFIDHGLAIEVTETGVNAKDAALAAALREAGLIKATPERAAGIVDRLRALVSR